MLVFTTSFHIREHGRPSAVAPPVTAEWVRLDPPGAEPPTTPVSPRRGSSLPGSASGQLRTCLPGRLVGETGGKSAKVSRTGRRCAGHADGDAPWTEPSRWKLARAYQDLRLWATTAGRTKSDALDPDPLIVRRAVGHQPNPGHPQRTGPSDGRRRSAASIVQHRAELYSNVKHRASSSSAPCCEAARSRSCVAGSGGRRSARRPPAAPAPYRWPGRWSSR